MSSERDPKEMRTIGEKVAWLRKQLGDLPIRPDCDSFAGTDMPSLGNSVFPANLGLEDPRRKTVSTFLLGSDWGNKDSFEKEQKSKKYSRGPFLSGAHRMLRNAGFDVSDIWYSNAWPVLRDGESKEEEHHPMRDDPEVTDAYRDYLSLCIRVLDPRLIITAGFACAWFMGPLIGREWQCGSAKSSDDLKSKDIDVNPVRLKSGIVVVAATHPSHLNNAKHRQFEELDGNETSLLTRARLMAGIPDYVEYV
jgi:hypothetical protein